MGRAVDVTEVTPQESGLAPDLNVVAIAFEVTRSVRGDVHDEVRVVRPRAAADSIEDVREHLPREPVLLFLRGADYGDYWALTSDLGAIAERGASLVTVFDESLAPNVVPAGVRTLDELIRFAE